MDGMFNIGRDGSQITIFDTLAGQVTFNGKVGYDTKPRIKKLESETLGGKTIFRYVPNGWEGSFTFDRRDSSLESYFGQWEANFYAGLPPPEAIITQTIAELSGGISQFQHIGVQLELTEGGEWKGLDKVTMKVGFNSSRRITLSIG